MEGGLQRDLELPLEVFGFELAEGRADRIDPGLNHAGGVDEDLDRAEHLLRRGDELEGLAAIGEVGDVREDGGAVAPQLGAALFDPLGRGRGDRDAPAEAREQARCREPDALVAAAARDERGSAREVERIVCHLRSLLIRWSPARDRSGSSGGRP